MSLLLSKPPALKELLTDLGCEALNGNESEEEIEELITQPGRERDLVMDWMAGLLEKDRNATLRKNQVRILLSSRYFRHSCVNCSPLECLRRSFSAKVEPHGHHQGGR